MNNDIDDDDDDFYDYHMSHDPFGFGGMSVEIPDFKNITLDSNTPNDELVTKITENISQVYDPEISVNVYDLGLIYKIAVDDEQNVKIDMTLTSPNCPAAQELPMVIQMAAGVINLVNDVTIDIVWDPPWGPDKMSDEAKLELGLF